MVKLATPTFVAGPRDALATADIYSQQSTVVINSIQKLVNDSNLDLQSVLRGGGAVAAQLSSLLPVIGSLKNGKLAINKEHLIARLALASGSINSGLRNLTSGMVARIGGNIPSTGALGSVVAKVGAITQQVSAAKLTDLASVGRTIAEVTGQPQLFSVQDRAAQIGVVTGLVQEAARQGLPDSFGALTQSIDDPQVLSQVCARTLPSIVQNSDVASLQSMATKMDSGQTQMIYPDVIGDFSTNYTHAEGSTAEEKQQRVQELMTTYTQIDPQWNTLQRDDPFVLRPEDSIPPDPIVKVTVVQMSSDEFKEVVEQNALRSDNMDDKLMVMGTRFEPTTVDEQLQQHFPYTATGAQERIVEKPQDPLEILNSDGPTSFSQREQALQESAARRKAQREREQALDQAESGQSSSFDKAESGKSTTMDLAESGQSAVNAASSGTSTSASTTTKDDSSAAATTERSGTYLSDYVNGRVPRDPNAPKRSRVINNTYNHNDDW